MRTLLNAVTATTVGATQPATPTPYGYAQAGVLLTSNDAGATALLQVSPDGTSWATTGAAANTTAAVNVPLGMFWRVAALITTGTVSAWSTK